MTPPRTTSPFHSWETVRYELLNTRVCDLGMKIEGSPIEPFARRLLRNFAAKGIEFRPRFYLADSWGCTDRVPVIGIPFYLADERLARIEEEQTGEIESHPMVVALLRHEGGHAINYAYRLWEQPGWEETFGRFSRPYREAFQPRPASREFVRHIFSPPYGRTYAQKHPDEDFAETFAVWLTPRSDWRRRYRDWPALRKLKYVDGLMREIRRQTARVTEGKLHSPVEQMDMLLAEHYGQQAERFRAQAQGYVDDRLRELFPPYRGATPMAAAALLGAHREDIFERITRWSGLDETECRAILLKLEDRARTLKLKFPRRQAGRKHVDLASMATALAMEFAYTGRLLN